MQKGKVYLYKYGKNLYVNMTNRCNCDCTFCLRRTRDEMDGSGSLWLEREPTVEEIVAAFDEWKNEDFEEVVFCGFGEPTMRLDDLLTVARFVRRTYRKKTRLNTNGLANLEYGKDVTPLLQGAIDVLSVSLNTPDATRYAALTRNRFGEAGFSGLLEFVKQAKKYVPDITLTTVSTTLSPEEEEACRKICLSLDVRYRIRPFEE